VPPSYTGTRAVPLVLDLHFVGGTVGLQQHFSGFEQKSDEAWRLAAGRGRQWSDAGE